MITFRQKGDFSKLTKILREGERGCQTWRP